MIPAITFHHAAEIEAAEAVEWYETEAGLGAAFREAVESAIAAIRLNPLAHPMVEGSTVRRALTHRFPYLIVYSFEADSIIIISVFHTSRNPLIWQNRI